MTWNEDTKRFLRHLQAAGRTPQHAANVRGILRRFGEHTGGKGWEEVSKDDVEGWLADLRGQGLSDSTVKGYFAYVKAILRYANDGENPASLKGLKAGAKESRIKAKGELLSEEEFHRLLNVMPPGKALIFRLLWDTGARPGEILRLRREDLSPFDRAGGREVVELTFPDTKSGEPRTVPVVNRETISALKSHLETVGDAILFPSPRQPGALKPQGLWRYLRRAARRAGLKKRVYPYLFRHTTATRRFNAPAGIRDRMMGWHSDMAKNYEHLDTKTVRDYLLETEGPPSAKMTEDEAKEILGRLIVRVSEDPALAKELREVLEGER